MLIESMCFAGEIQADAQDQFTVNLPVNTVVTLSTITTAVKGSYPKSPESAAFPIPYHENFNPNNFSEAFNFADQSGAFETFHNASSTDGHEWTLRQVFSISFTIDEFPYVASKIMSVLSLIF